MNDSTIDNVVLVSTYRLTGTIFRMNAEIILREFQARGEVMPGNIRAIPFYYLMSHAIELFLKCALLKRGESADGLRRYPLGHGLRALLQKLKEMNVPVSESAGALISAMSQQHERHDLRYTALLDDGVMTFTPEPSAMFEVLDDLLLAGRISTHGN